MKHYAILTLELRGIVTQGSVVPLHTGEGIINPGDSFEATLIVQNLLLVPRAIRPDIAYQPNSGWSSTIGARSVADARRWWVELNGDRFLAFTSHDPWPFATGGLSFWFRFPLGFFAPT